MSYILEALKKADAAREREREAVPGLHSRHDHALPDETDERPEGAPAARTPWLVGGIAGGVVIAGALFWLLGRSGPDAPMTAATRPMPMHGQVGEAAPPVLPQAPVTTSVPGAAPQVPQQTPTAPAAMAPAPVQAPPVQPTQATSPQPATVTTPPIAKPPAATARVPSTQPAPDTPAARTAPPAQDPLRVDPSLREVGPKVVSMQELPDDIRRELPPLTVGGAMHSDVAANRMLVLNGGVLREGDQPAPGVVLEEIRLKSAVLRYKGHRYSISY